MTKPVSPGPDAVSEVLRSVAVRSTVFCLSELRAPWAFRVDGEKVPKFHLVLEGSAFLSCGGEPPIGLRAGDLVVLPRGARHTLANDQATPTVTLERLLAEARLDGGSQLRYGGTGAVTRLLCGGFSLAEGLPESAVAAFPEVIRIDHRKAAATSWLEHVLATLRSEADNGMPGANALVAKIADVLLVQALRTWLIEAEPGAIVPFSAVEWGCAGVFGGRVAVCAAVGVCRVVATVILCCRAFRPVGRVALWQRVRQRDHSSPW
jgi:mannose-6-phosphate isomerase-like protein (cupin superfamily)